MQSELMKTQGEPGTAPRAPVPSKGEKWSSPAQLRRFLLNIFLLTAGAVIYAVGLNGILVPKQFLSGGVIGIALILHYLFNPIDAGYYYFILNIPLMLLGWFRVSRQFMFYTAYGMVVFSLATAFVKPGPLPIENPILAALLAGIICGTGSGITLRSRGSAGGLDILAVYLYKKLSLTMGSTISFVSAAVLLAGGLLFGLEMALYSLVFVYSSGRIMNAVMTRFNQRKSILIVSDRSDAVAERILSVLNRGVTFLDGTGAYSGHPKKVILSIITMTELSKLKELVFDIDPHAFMVVNDTLEVLGYRHGEMRVY